MADKQLRQLGTDTPLPLAQLYAGLTLDDPGVGRGHVALCMVSSADGAVTVDGLSEKIGGEADLLAMSRIRGANDVSLVGASTVRKEGYVPLTGSATRRADRVRRGLTAAPRLAIVTGTGNLDPSLHVFDVPSDDPTPLVLAAAEADQAALARLEAANIEVARLPAAAKPSLLNAPALVATLVERGLRRIVCEGGPRVNQALLQADLIDEVFLTIAPALAGGPAQRIIHGSQQFFREMTLISAFEYEGDLLLRYRR